MAKGDSTPKNDIWLKELGACITALIIKKGYSSAYDFWIQEIGEDISRSGLFYILKGQKDPRATTLRLIARKLDISVEDLFPKYPPAPVEKYKAE